MPVSRRSIDPEAAWPSASDRRGEWDVTAYCAIGREIRLQQEGLMDVIEKSKGKRLEELWTEKVNLEEKLQEHYNRCTLCVDGPSETRARTAARSARGHAAPARGPRDPRPSKPQRPAPGGRAHAGRADAPGLLRRPARPRAGRPQAEDVVSRATRLLEGTVVAIRHLPEPCNLCAFPGDCDTAACSATGPVRQARQRPKRPTLR